MAKTKIVWGPRGTKRFYINDKEVTEEEWHARFPSKIDDLLAGYFPQVQSPEGWPKRSLALAVHKDQVAEANDRNKKHGIGTRYDTDGTAVIPDNGDRRKLLKLEGFVDKDSFL